MNAEHGEENVQVKAHASGGRDQKLRISQPVGHGRIFDGSRPCFIETEYVLQGDPRRQGLLLP